MTGIEANVTVPYNRGRPTVPDGVRQQLIEGAWDTTSDLLAARDEIARTASRLPYFDAWNAPA